jgi:hypothetical protein
MGAVKMLKVIKTSQAVTYKRRVEVICQEIL